MGRKYLGLAFTRKWPRIRNRLIAKLCMAATSLFFVGSSVTLTTLSFPHGRLSKQECACGPDLPRPTCPSCGDACTSPKSQRSSSTELVESTKEAHSMQDYSILEIRPRVQERLPTIHMVTPTYKRPTQMAELTRLAQTLAHVPSLLWIVVDDGAALDPVVDEFLRYTKLDYVYLAADKSKEPTTPRFKTKRTLVPRGVACRMAGLDWIRRNSKDGVVYFGDDDNTYDLRIFDEMRWTKKVAMWPVGLVSDYGISSPIVDLESGKVTGFYDGWVANRVFPVDMAGFSISVRLVLEKSGASMPYRAGFEEDGFLRSLGIQRSEIEPKASNCTKVLVWHTKTTWMPMTVQELAPELIKATNLAKLLASIKT